VQKFSMIPRGPLASSLTLSAQNFMTKEER
jgi:hypothetical protein